VVLRFRRAGRAERQQLLWLLVGGLLLILSLFVQSVLPAGVEDLAWSVGLIGALAAIAVAVLRSGVFDVDLVLNRTLVTLILAGLVFVAYLAAVALLGQFELSDRVTVGLVAMISLLAVSAYDAVQRLVNRLLLAGAADPYAVVLRVGGRLDQASSPADALATLVEELRDALRLPYVAIRATVGDLPPLASGAPPDTALSEFPITNQGAKVGTLHVGQRRTQGGRFAPEERTLLEDVCRRAGALVQAAVLVADLQRSRERIVAAREEERRRLRHDLHDGVGPRLAGMALQLDSLTDRLAHDPELAARAERIRELMRATLAEVRQVVDALRPPALDELGLVGALTEQLSAFAVDDAPRPPRHPRADRGRGRPAAAACRRGGRRLPDRRGGRDQRRPARPGPAPRRPADRGAVRAHGRDRRRRHRHPRGGDPGRRPDQHARACHRGRRGAGRARTPRGWHADPRAHPAAAPPRRRFPGARMTTRVVVADDHPVFREGLVVVLADLDDVEVVAEAADGDAAIAAVAEHAPDVVVMDLQMPGVGGIEATRRIVAEHPDVAVLVLTMSADDDSVYAALRAGARGFLLKDADKADLARALAAVSRGEAVFGPKVASSVLSFFAGARSGAAVPFPQLTEREREVLDLMARGLDNPTIARRLFLSDKTVRNRVSAIFQKLDVSSRAEAVAVARDAGLGEGP
jgi:DNA-binding NarL/FixJ family response regulator/signal transduction histidine kinase